MLPLKALLDDHHARVLTFSGHGLRAEEPLDFMRFVDDIHAAIMHGVSERVHLFGYSMGGYAALLYAARYPQQVLSVTTLGTIFVWSDGILAQELRKLEPAVIEKKVPAFARTLAAWHGETAWRAVVLGIAARMKDLSSEPMLTVEVLRSITCPVLCCVGDGDTGADPERTRQFAQGLPNAHALVLPDTKHAFETVRLDTLLPFVRAHWAASEG